MPNHLSLWLLQQRLLHLLPHQTVLETVNILRGIIIFLNVTKLHTSYWFMLCVFIHCVLAFWTALCIGACIVRVSFYRERKDVVSSMEMSSITFFAFVCILCPVKISLPWQYRYVDIKLQDYHMGVFVLSLQSLRLYDMLAQICPPHWLINCFTSCWAKCPLTLQSKVWLFWQGSTVSMHGNSYSPLTILTGIPWFLMT